MNITHIIGNLTADPESRTVNTSKGPMDVCNLNVAVNRYFGGQKVTDYFRITLWNRMAANAMQYLRKGSKVAVTGPVTARAWTARDGSNRASLEIQQVESIEYLSHGSGGAPGGADEATHGPEPGEFTEVQDDELPF